MPTPLNKPTGYMLDAAGTAQPLVSGTAAVGTSIRYAREDHVHPAAGDGVAGQRGATGTVGATGVKGATGEQGATGNGVTGATGATGSAPYNFCGYPIAETAPTEGQYLVWDGDAWSPWTRP